MGGRGAAGGGGKFTHKGVEIRGASKMPRTQAEWNSYDKKVDAGKAAPRRSIEGSYMTEQYLKQSIRKKGGGYVIGREGPKIFGSKKRAQDSIGDSLPELKAHQRGG